MSLSGIPRLRRFLAATWLLATLACTSEGPADAGFALLDGVEVMEAGEVGDTPTLPWRLGEAPVVRVGGRDQGEGHLFVEISAATLLPDGGILIADSRGGLVGWYGPDGSPRGPIGSRGEGPGEYQAPSSLLLSPGDSILIWDRSLWRTSVFDLQGNLVRSERYDPTAAGVYPIQGMWPEEVRLGGRGSRLIRLIRKSDVKVTSGREPDLVGLAIHRQGATEVDLIQLLPREKQVEVEAPWGPALLTPPLAAGPSIAMDREGGWACVGHQTVPELLCIGASGHRVGLRWSSPPRPVLSDDPVLSRWQDETVAAYSLKISEQDAREVVSAVPVPESYPAFGDLLFDEEGFLWVGLGPSFEEPSVSDYLIFGPELRPEGRFALPTLNVLEIGADYVLGVRRDDLGVEEVVVLPLSR